MEENKKSKLQEALKKKLESVKNNKNINKTDTKLKQSFNKRNKIHVDNLGKRPQNRGD